MEALVLKILQIHNFYQLAGGEDSVVANERSILEQAGHRVELLSANNASISGVREKIRTFLNTKYNETARAELSRVLRAYQPDVVHVHNFFPLFSPSIFDACSQSGFPLVHTLHNFRPLCASATLFRAGRPCELCLDGHTYHAVVHRCYRGSIIGSLAAANMIAYHRRTHTWSTAANRYIALTSFARDKFVSAGFPADRIAIKPNFASDPRISDPKSRYGALFVGRLSPEKGIQTLLEAWANVDYPLLIIGDGPQRDALDVIKSPNIKYLGQLAKHDVSAAMSTAQMIIIPSLWYEGFPMVLIEALSHGLPVVASRIGALAEIVQDRVTGCLFSPGDSDELATVVNDLLRQPQNLIEYGIAARKLYESKYTPERNIVELTSIYHEAIEENVSGRK
jgi:glycosyltransferase involved in cell wall biosynthesis